MSDFDGGGPAFPHGNPEQGGHPGEVTLWDYYAAAALNGVMAHEGCWNDDDINEAATAADAMLSERRKRYSDPEPKQENERG